MFYKAMMAAALLCASVSFASPSSNPNVFKIFPLEGDYRFQGGGTAFLLKLDEKAKVVITNRHVCEIKPKAQLYALQFKDEDFSAKFGQVSEKHDLCILYPSLRLYSEVEGIPLSDKKPELDTKVTVIGHPALGPQEETKGTVLEYSITRLQFEPTPLLIPSYITDAPILRGSSGSPVFNEAKDLVGVIFACRVDPLIGDCIDAAFMSSEALVDFIKNEVK